MARTQSPSSNIAQQKSPYGSKYVFWTEQTGCKWCLYCLKKMGETETRPNLTPSIKVPLRSYQYTHTQGSTLVAFEQIQMTKYPLNTTGCGAGSHIVYSYDIFSPPSVCADIVLSIFCTQVITLFNIQYTIYNSLLILPSTHPRWHRTIHLLYSSYWGASAPLGFCSTVIISILKALKYNFYT